MADVLRIIDQFQLEGKGVLYTVKKNKNVVIGVDDVYYDLQGNRFRVVCIEMVRRTPNETNSNNEPVGIVLESLDYADVCGTLLVSKLNEINFLFCNHPLYKDRVDEDYESEYQIANQKYNCALFSYEDLEQRRLSMYGQEIKGLTIYRGWMMKSEMYRTFYSLLEERGIILINSPEEYERYHYIPGWYDDFREYTADTIWETQGKLENAMNMIKDLEGSYIVKDYVKSRKHEWYDACYIGNVADEKQTECILKNFINRQGDALVGGVVLRKYEQLKKIGFHEKSGMPLSEEYRVFVYAGRMLVIDDYWRKGEMKSITDAEICWIEKLIARVKSNFVTIDLARKESGELIVMELGDGQVSGIQQIRPEDFYVF